MKKLNFMIALRSENHMQTGFAMQKKLKACGFIDSDTACFYHVDFIAKYPVLMKSARDS
jgi:hypothetical protein